MACNPEEKTLAENGGPNESGDHLIQNGEVHVITKRGKKHEADTRVLYKVYETPAPALSIFLALQHYLSMFFATLSIPFLLSDAICMDEDNVGKAEIIGTIFVASGVITLMQNFFGVRLPIVQAGTIAILMPTLSYFKLEKWKCPSNIVSPAEYENISFYSNSTDDYIIAGSPEHREIWQLRLREIQGAIMCAALLEVFLGATGLVGLLLRFIGPLCIMPTITLLGLGMFRGAATYGSKNWAVCGATIFLIVLFSQYLGHIEIACPKLDKDKGTRKSSFPFFKMFPIMFAMGIMWIVCLVLTETGVFADDKDSFGYFARTDLRSEVIATSPWFRLPYPCQWGMPTVSIEAVCAILAGVIATTIESVGDYHSCAKLADAPPPPLHAVNRGILVEGIGSFLDGLMGTGNGTTSTSINVGVVGITKVGSRVVVQLSAFFMISLGLFTKFGAIFVSIPEPVIGASFYILFGMIVAVGISNVQHVDLNSGRNLFILGMSIFLGLSVPFWMASNHSALKTGNATVDNICIVLLSTGMFVGGMTGLFLDNTIRGTPEERGIAQWQKSRDTSGDLKTDPRLRREMRRVYDLPYIMPLLNKFSWTSRIPTSPTYGMPLQTEEMDMEEAALNDSQGSVGIEPDSGEVKVPPMSTQL